MMGSTRMIRRMGQGSMSGATETGMKENGSRVFAMVKESMYGKIKMKSMTYDNFFLLSFYQHITSALFTTTILKTHKYFLSVLVTLKKLGGRS